MNIYTVPGTRNKTYLVRFYTNRIDNIPTADARDDTKLKAP